MSNYLLHWLLSEKRSVRCLPSLRFCRGAHRGGALRRSGPLAKDRARTMDVSKLQEKKAALEEELQRTEENIYDLEGEYLQACSRAVTCHKPRQG